MFETPGSHLPRLSLDSLIKPSSSQLCIEFYQTGTLLSTYYCAVLSLVVEYIKTNISEGYCSMAQRSIINVIDEFNENGHLVYADDYVGAYSRGRTMSEAFAKLPREIECYNKWLGIDDTVCLPVIAVKESHGGVSGVEDADSIVLFESEMKPLTDSEYRYLKALAVKSAKDFLKLYLSIPNKTETTLPYRKTFYGDRPRTAQEMYIHTKNVNSYYFGEIDIDAENSQDIVECRIRGFEKLEKTSCFLDNPVFHGSYDEDWSLRKVFRRFIWHDRIHAKAMYRMASALCGKENIDNPFCF